MHRLFAFLVCLILIPCLTACSSTGQPADPTVQLTEAADAFDGTINVLSQAKAANLIPDAWNVPIAQGYVAAKAALQKMNENLATNPTAFQAAFNDFNAAMVALVNYRQQVQTPVSQPTTQPTKGILYEPRSPTRVAAIRNVCFYADCADHPTNAGRQPLANHSRRTHRPQGFVV